MKKMFMAVLFALASVNAMAADCAKGKIEFSKYNEDDTFTVKVADANATIESLRADVSAGRKRLQVAATCAKSTTGASSMGDGESPGLTADAELNYYRLRSGIDKITAQVNYLQEYIRTQCLK
uniref:Lysis protein n=1 Tax=Escherichia coli TaxID=562 RepID=A0A160RIE0_ECOLX|nr:lysis protein [Escherichia coli]